jgi:hypothetical protein
MPKCPICSRNVKSNDLQRVGKVLACKKCRRPKKIKETKMAENEYDRLKGRKKLMSFHIYEVPTKDGARDHQIEVEVAAGGFNLQYITTFDQVRDFFTRHREKGKPARLKAVE